MNRTHAADAQPGTEYAAAPPARAAGTLGILAGIGLIVLGLAAWITVSLQLREEKITVPDDAMAFQGKTVAGPLTAFAQAAIIQHHALGLSGGKTYAELDRDDPVRVTLMDASFLRASLFTSVVSFGVAAFAMGVGALSVVFGWGLRRAATPTTVVVTRPLFSRG
ncbi:aromatic ring-opening dioxygenase LigA [Microbacterium sp. zg.Y1090]|uniref:aromatic ring-opening dioxygenase LigA n=1 Tax=Microbacterium TaxID=33882 RepID=UPI00214CC2AA|nr:MULTISPECIES: aromatic ring-opening dioxygenase LigA [unclassified Microbacterium]MCR2814027.1 aromatic ring-opening dioxygenase LigA [Microbacterium sp. zg.Y1084]MCR2819301.1 aromatic ring-opening dioxygenase LigA [Microbacterium sp. zg.Y1090]MDL5487218.1 aromatic ring-opening dioxygenase LigA [Microbacterium sp. zg-Y1211]WIM28283.1 aromatic ring-opening dioxygenase LigA [Microbacterium sp. zg-Y1090]